MRNGYIDKLQRLARQCGFEVWNGKQITCLHRLENPRHIANSKDCEDGIPIGAAGGRNIVNPVWFRRGPAADPKQWALLSQVHAPFEDPGGTALRLGAAPYGNKTEALLYLGRSR